MFQTLIPANSLAETRSTTAILDCRAHLMDLDWGRGAFEAGHIEGAQFIDLATDLSDPPGLLGRHPLPDRDRMAERFRALGINNGQQIVFYDDAGGAIAARGWWLARWLGHEAAAVLDGGLAAWTRPLATGPAEDAAPGDFRSTTELTMTVEADDIARGAFTLIDARTLARYNGDEEPIDPVAGHIPGAVCYPFQGNLDAAGHFLPPEKLRSRFQDLDTTRPLVSYCGSGVTAAHNILAMRHAEIESVALYPGSWSGWITDPSRPIATKTSPKS